MCQDCPGRQSIDDIIGKTFAGRFEVEAFLEEGGMGRVYRARQVGMDRAVALKVLLPDLAADDELVARFHREMRATTAIEHPNTVRVYDYGSAEDGQLFLALEFLEGRTLDEIIADEAPVSPARAAHIARGIARALAAAHHHAIVHRDLKPENVMLVDRYGRSDFVKVLDFGLARLTEGSEDEALTATGIRVGSPMYMSPEYVQEFTVTPQSDLYALGVLLYQLVTGRTPFRGRPYELLSKHVTEKPKPPSTYAPVPQWLEELILQLLAKKPSERPQGAEAVVAYLEQWAPEAQADVQVLEQETEKRKSKPAKAQKERSERKSLPPQPPSSSGNMVLAGLVTLLVALLGVALVLTLVLIYLVATG
ncbi:MAG: serine/threonine protein kinase [Deltaproteobacteria bacterium]|nr:MAG: serine/threonine protein kinase [Deltaproteobacteria bacterium]